MHSPIFLDDGINVIPYCILFHLLCISVFWFHLHIKWKANQIKSVQIASSILILETILKTTRSKERKLVSQEKKRSFVQATQTTHVGKRQQPTLLAVTEFMEKISELLRTTYKDKALGEFHA